jgi:hypothetical protein
MNKYKPRLGENFDKGDVLAMEAMNQELTGLQEEQEQARAVKQQKDQQFQQEAVQTFVDGGKLTKRQTQSVSSLLTPPSQPQGNQQGPQIAGQSLFAKGGKLPKYQGGGFNQIPYGQPAYPYSQYFGDKTQDYLGAFQGTPFNAPTGAYQAGDFSNPQLNVSPYDLIQGRSPLDPLQRGAQAQAGRFVDNTRPGRASLGIDETRPGRASLGLGQGQGQAQGQPDGSLGNFQGANLNFPQVQGDEPLGFDGGLGGYDGLTATDKLGLTYRGSKTSPSGKPAQAAASVGAGSINTGDIFRNNQLGQDAGLGFTPDSLPQTRAGAVAQTGAGAAGQQQGFDMFQSRVPWWGAAATGLGNILANRQLDLPAGENIEDVTAQQIAPRLVDYSRSREQIQRERDRSQAQIRSVARSRGTQQGLTQTTIAGATATQGIAGQQFTASQEAQANKNAQIKQATNMFNAQQRSQADQTNLRSAMMREQLERENQLINAGRRGQQISGVAGAITQYGQDRIASGQYDQLINMRMADKDFGFQQDDPTFGRRFFGVTDPARIQFNNPNLRVSG